MKFQILILSLLTQSAFGADRVALQDQFTREFHSHYRPNFCDDSVHAFALRAKRNRINLENMYVVMVERNTWDAVAPKTISPLNPRLPTKRWYYHSVIIADGYVFDFDYGASPTAVSAKEYLAKMFTDETMNDLVVKSIYWPEEDWFIIAPEGLGAMNVAFRMKTKLTDLIRSPKTVIKGLLSRNRELGTTKKITMRCSDGLLRESECKPVSTHFAARQN